MLNEALLKTIACLEEDYKPLYTKLSTLDEYLSDDERKLDIHKVLRVKLLNELELVAAGTPKALTMHRALRALTRLYPLNSNCPYTLEAIDMDNVDSYFSLSTGYVISRTAEIVQNLAENRHSWKNPLTNEAYSSHDIDYIERLCNITRPAAAASADPIDVSNFPPELVQLIYLNMFRDTYLMLQAFEVLNAQLEQSLQPREGLHPAGSPQQPDQELREASALQGVAPQRDPNPHGWTVDDIEGSSPHARHVQAVLQQHEHATRRPLLQSLFNRRVNPSEARHENNPAQPRNRNRDCTLL